MPMCTPNLLMPSIHSDGRAILEFSSIDIMKPQRENALTMFGTTEVYEMIRSQTFLPKKGAQGNNTGSRVYSIDLLVTSEEKEIQHTTRTACPWPRTLRSV